MRKYDNQSGRSMIEMLGVLAIVGVLSVAGISGYSKAMGKYKVNKVMDQVSTLAANIKTMFAASGYYTELADYDTADNLGLIPEDVHKTGTNGLNGGVFVGPVDSGAAFAIGMTGLTREACTTMVTSDWGGAAGFRGLKAEVKASGYSLTTSSYSVEGSNDGSTGVVLPTDSADVAFAAAAAGCGCDNATCTITWVFY